MYSDKVVIVTGASQGIGNAIARAYREQGATVVGFDLHQPATGDMDFYSVDLGKPEMIEAAFDSIARQYVTAHILINNGAISQFNKPVAELTAAEFSRVIDVNLSGSFNCAREFVRHHSDNQYGRIINIASTRWHQNEPGWEAYGASKGGLVSLTNTLAISLAQTPITVNAISPGWIQTEDYDQLTVQDHRQHPSGRVGKPRDIVNTCLFLTHEENDFINGANIVVDGGMTKKMIYL
ncbi:SDR family oxidoreductase [Thalassotalea sp. G20_0]|uniref:SDR family NAD(P)-dependent oxidoreductase n=1 Tax=Thalassotalea sp. G20_0 TaxID=2821093 RepID=UPI001AD9AF17|nr:SDR family oxidoreductase [Thalassotalea sp. G20_0]MBO9494502.1 SDR family oxidoreductase [Thalassotalea sp. G20_0]